MEENSQQLFIWLWCIRVNGTDDTIGTPSWDRFGQILGWAKRSVMEETFGMVTAVIAFFADATVEMSMYPIFISYAPFTRVHQSLIFAAGVPGDIVAR